MIIVIPMAGRGSRFANVGYSTPKPLIDVCGKPMLCHAFKSVEGIPYTKLVFIALKEHQEQYDVRKVITDNITTDFELVLLDDVTEGQLCTVMEAKQFFVPGEDLLIAASDTYVKSEIGKHIANKPVDCTGIISVADLPGDRWSFAKTDETGRVVEVAEKVKISDHASTGLYYFSDVEFFARQATQLIDNKETTKGEYYVMPLYGKYIAQGLHLTISEADEMWDMGTPDAKQAFENYLNGQ